MRNGVFISVFISFFTNGVFSQSDQDLDVLIKYHKTFEIKAIDSLFDKIQPLKLKQLAEYDLAYLKNGELVDVSNITVEDMSGRKRIFADYLLGSLRSRSQKKKDALDFLKLKRNLSDSQNLNDTLLINEGLRRICNHLFINGKKLDELDTYVKESEAFAQDSVDLFYSKYYQIGLEFLKVEETPRSIDSLKIENLFKLLKGYAPSKYFLGHANNFHSIFYSAYQDDQERAYAINRKAIENWNSSNFYFSQKGIHSIAFNDAIINYERGDYDSAITIFERILKNEKQQVYRMFGYDWLHKCYDSIGNHVLAYDSFKKMAAVKDSLNLLDHAREIAQIESQYDFEKKERELELMVNEKKTMETSLKNLIPVVIFSLMAALIGLFLFIKFRRRSEVLGDEKDRTLKEIDKLKKVVVKNHILLKDKSKIYISDLMYIKAEDHYLNLFLSNGKTHLVRGKLKKIKKELPPNFIQCHRSFIVNSNFIKRINSDSIALMNKERLPLSRSHKNKF